VGDLIRHVNSMTYHDNRLTRMLANVPRHFRAARMILENNFLVGMSYDLLETVHWRLGLYFRWKEMPDKAGCVMGRISNSGGSSTTSSHRIIEKSPEWRFVARRKRREAICEGDGGIRRSEDEGADTPRDTR
jgi:hypothetical protein